MMRAPGGILVALQLGLLALLAWRAWPHLSASISGPQMVLLGAGVALGLWALSANRPGNFNIHPVPRPGGHLVQHGPYRWLRHPMYSALMLAGLAAALAAWDMLAWASFAALVLVLAVKAALEERFLARVHPGYGEYQRRSRRFIPFVY